MLAHGEGVKTRGIRDSHLLDECGHQRRGGPVDENLRIELNGKFHIGNSTWSGMMQSTRKALAPTDMRRVLAMGRA